MIEQPEEVEGAMPAEDRAEEFWESLPSCKYGIGANNERGYEECGEPATCRVRWGNGEWLYLCAEHVRKVEDGR